MHLRLTKHLLIFGIFMLMTSCDSGQKVNKPPTKIAVIADSIGNGYNLAIPWPTLLQQSLDIPVINTSISGKQTDWGLEVIEDILDTHKPSHLLISLGTNDAAFNPQVSAAVSNLQLMADIANKKSVAVLIGTVIPNLGSDQAEQRAIEINKGIMQMRNITIVDSRARMGDAQNLLADGVHPNQLGQQTIADAFRDVLVAPSRSR
jgi:acyl-CoA thioesterase-1